MALQKGVPALARVSTLEALEAAIRDTVFTGGYAAGSPLREVELASTYGVGRNSVRAALQALVLSGLLRHEQNRGVFVPEFTADDVVDLFRVRRAIETEAVLAIIRGKRSAFAVDDALERLQTLPNSADWMTAVIIDLGLHAAIVESGGSPRMRRVYGGLLSELQLLLSHVSHLYPQPTVLGPIHSDIVEALRARQAKSALAKLGEHLDDSEAEIVAAVERVAAEGKAGS